MVRYNNDLLEGFCYENDLILEKKYDHLNRETIINGKCKNVDCELFDQLITYQRARITIVNSTALDRNDWCAKCGSKSELIREPGMTKMVYGTDLKTRKT